MYRKSANTSQIWAPCPKTDLQNMEHIYYTIRILTASKYMTDIITEFGKFRYNCLSMVMCALGNMSQAKVDEILGDIKGVKTYINNILVLSKDILSNSIYKLRLIFYRLHVTGIKYNTHK